MKWQTEVSLSLSLTNTYNQHLRPPRTYAVTTTTRILSILSLVAWVTLIIGRGRAHGTAEFRNDHNDAGERRSGTPGDEQGLSCTHTPLPGACVCLRATCTDSPRDACACLPCYDNYCEEITLPACVHGMRVCVHMDVCVYGHLLKGD